MKNSDSDKISRFFENIYRLVEHYINVVDYDNSQKIGVVDMHKAEACANAAERMLDAIDENADSPLVNLIWQVLFEYSNSFDLLIESGPFLSEIDYIKNYLYLARCTSDIMFTLTNWIDNPRTGNGYSLLKLAPAFKCGGEILYYDYDNRTAVTSYFSFGFPIYCVARHGEATFQLGDFNGNYKTRIDLRNIEAPFDTKGIFFDDRSKKYLIE